MARTRSNLGTARTGRTPPGSGVRLGVAPSVKQQRMAAIRAKRRLRARLGQGAAAVVQDAEGNSAVRSLFGAAEMDDDAEILASPLPVEGAGSAEAHGHDGK